MGDVTLDTINGTASDLLTDEMTMAGALTRPNMKWAKGDFPHTAEMMMTGDLMLNLLKTRGDYTLGETSATADDPLSDEMTTTGDPMPDQQVVKGDVTLDKTNGTASDLLTDEMMMTGDLTRISMMMTGDATTPAP